MGHYQKVEEFQIINKIKKLMSQIFYSFGVDIFREKY
jgi:hypothetical protein